ncbi:general secretion pathway protein GspC [Sorangium cellulosum]|uniref:General secretion pathway protein GspC n=1 Tax=Sorangium cellulosum TaxID=56 RepID=A0A2L0EXZ5_SORCE|nr:type II secretion system protein GspC [Sorangium cellulosum]AUX44172.1 general secretion pathway protein GspC [Sorangium cellulosum]
MIPELLIKRIFPALLGGMIMTAAYQQASGISYLVEEAWISSLPPAPPRAPTSPPPVVDTNEHATSAAAILARNPFDSVTGPLTPKPAVEREEDEGSAIGADPLLDPICEDTRVLLITASEDPSWSFATIAAGRGEPLLRRAGDPVEGRSVLAIGWDRVWFAEPGARCQVRIGDNRLAPAAARAPRAAAPAPRPAAKPKRGALPPEIASKIRKVSDREFIVDRTAIEMILENQGELMRSARIVPAKEGDRVVGVRLARVAAGSLLTAVGLRRGDTIRSINGFDLTDPQSALQAYARLRSADHLAVAVRRGESDMTIDLRIQ